MANERGSVKLNDFVDWMQGQGLSSRTISNNQTYVGKCAGCLSHSLDEVVTDDKLMADSIKEIAAKLEVGGASKSCYVGGFMKYYQFKRGVRFPKKVKAQCCHWYQEIIVDEVSRFFDVVRKFNSRNAVGAYDDCSWAFRGQGEALWGLESSLGRVAGYSDQNCLSGEMLKMFEREAMWSFRREVSHYPEYRDFEGVDLLALMQHYECKTRLLDFTMTPLLALFMALEQNDQLYLNGKEYATKHLNVLKAKCERPDFAVWAVNLNSFRDDNKDLKPADGSRRLRTVEDAWAEANEIINAKENWNKTGVKIVFPSKCNKRISAQDGLFLMANNLAVSFEENLRQSLPDLNGDNIVPVALSSIVDDKIESISPVCKFIFSSDLRKEVKTCLLEANITAKAVYPDLIGLGRFVSDIIQRHRN